MTYGADRPSERHIKELQSTHDALAALIQELDELQHDLRVLEQADQCDNSPIARLEQVHNKNEELRDHIRKLVKEKAEFRANLSSLEDQVMEYRKREAEIDETQKASREAELQLKSEQLMWEAQRNSLKSDLLKLEAERDALESSLNRASLENANLRNSQTRPDPESPNQDVNANKISSDSGWTIQKVCLHSFHFLHDDAIHTTIRRFILIILKIRSLRIISKYFNFEMNNKYLIN